MAQLKEGSIIKKPTGDEVIATLNDMPVNTSELTNDSGYLTSVSKSDVGLSNVDNIKQATKVEHEALDTKVTSHLADDVIHGIYTDTVQTNIKYKLVIIDEEPFLEVVEV